MTTPAEIDIVEHIRNRNPRSPKRSLSRWILLITLLVLTAGSVRWWLYSQGFESTDDAQIEGHLDSLSPRISGTVIYINPQGGEQPVRGSRNAAASNSTRAITKRSWSTPRQISIRAKPRHCPPR